MIYSSKCKKTGGDKGCSLVFCAADRGGCYLHNGGRQSITSPSRRDCALALDGFRHELSEAAVPAEEVDQKCICQVNSPSVYSLVHLSVCRMFSSGRCQFESNPNTTNSAAARHYAERLLSPISQNSSV